MHFDMKRVFSHLFMGFLVVLVTACGGSGGEESDNALLDDNTPPQAFDQNLTLSHSTVVEDGTVEITLRGEDVDGDILKYKIIKQPSYGSLQGEAPNLIYIPNPNYAGEDYFIFSVDDGYRTAEATVIVTILDANDAPIAHDDNRTTEEDTQILIEVLDNDSDIDGTLDSTSLLISTTPTHGTAVVTDGKVTYTPEENYHGADGFSYTVKDDDGTVSNEASVHVVITSVNDAPMAYDDNVTTDEGVSVSLEPLLNDLDTDGNTSRLHIVSITQPHYGIAILEGSFVHYTPQSDNATQDLLTYTIEDESGGRAMATIKIDILLHNDVPIAHGETIETNEDQAVSFELNGTDPDNDDINYTLVHADYIPQNGLISGTAPRLTYTPNANFTGEDYIVFRVNDRELESAVAVVKIIIHPLNDPPIAIAGDDVAGIRGDSIVLDGSESYDIDGNITAYEWREGNHTLSTEKHFSQVFYDEGVHTITLRVTDDHNATGSDEKIITINPCCEGCIYPDPTQTNPFN